MPFLNENELRKIGFKSLGHDVKISSLAAIYNPEKIHLGNNVRIDDFCIISGKLDIGNNVHIASHCNVVGGDAGIIFEDFTGLAFGCHIFTESDNYDGRFLTNATIPKKYRDSNSKKIHIKKHCIIGAQSVILPGIILEVGCAVGANSLISKSTEAWSIYFGNPAKKIKNRKNQLLELEAIYLDNLCKKQNDQF